MTSALTLVASMLEEVPATIEMLPSPADNVANHLRSLASSLEAIHTRATGSTSRRNLVASIIDLRDAAEHLANAMYLITFVDAPDEVEYATETDAQDPVAIGGDR